MKALYFILPVLLLSNSTGAQLNVNKLVHLVDCRDFACVATSAQTNGYQFADSTYDGEYKVSQYVFEHKPIMSVSGADNMLTLLYDNMVDRSVVYFNTVVEDFYRQMLNDIISYGFVVYQTLPAGGVIYNYPGTRLTIFVETQTYEDGLHYTFTVNNKPE